MPSITPKGLTTLSAGLGVAAVLSFLAGFVMLGGGVMLPSKGGGSPFSFGGGPEKPGYEDGHPVGLYLMTRYWIATGSLETAVWYFTSDGHAYKDPEDLSEEALAAHKGDHATVRAEGDDMIFTWSDGKESRSKLEKEKGGFNWDMGIFAPVEGFDDEEELAGKWEGGKSVSFSGNYAATSNTLEIREDGTFRQSGVSSFRTTSNDSTVSTGGSGNDSGQWSLDGYSLTLTYENGKSVRGVSFPFDDEETPVKPDRFYFAGTMYKKQG